MKAINKVILSYGLEKSENYGNYQKEG